MTSLPERIAEGIAVAYAPKPGSLSAVVTAVVAKGGRAAVFDSGMPGHVGAWFEAALTAAGASPSDVSSVCCTHGHADHVGGSRELAELCRADIAFCAQDAELAGFAPHRALDDGDVIDLGGLAFRTIATPGHTGGSACFYEPRLRLLIAGDAVQGWGFRHRPPVYFDSGLEYRASIRRLLELDVETVVTGHPVVTAEGPTCVHRGQGARSLIEDSLTASTAVAAAVATAVAAAESPMDDEPQVLRGRVLTELARYPGYPGFGHLTADEAAIADVDVTLRSEARDLRNLRERSAGDPSTSTPAPSD